MNPTRQSTSFLLCTMIVLGSFHTVLSQVVVNGGFESGRGSGWTEHSKGGYTLIGTAAFFHSTEITPDVNPRSGQYMGRIGGYGYEENALTQTMTLPNVTPLYLKMYYQTRSSSTSECAGLWVGAEIKVMVAGQVLYQAYLCKYNDQYSWTYGYFDITAAAGQTIEISFIALAANSVWSFLYLDDVSVSSSPTGVVEDTLTMPQFFELNQNYPNPFNPTTTIKFRVPSYGFVSLKVYDVLGREVKTLVSEEKPAGYHGVVFDAGRLASGVYFYRITANGNNGECFVSTKKLVLMK